MSRSVSDDCTKLIKHYDLLQNHEQMLFKHRFVKRCEYIYLYKKYSIKAVETQKAWTEILSSSRFHAHVRETHEYSYMPRPLIQKI